MLSIRYILLAKQHSETLYRAALLSVPEYLRPLRSLIQFTDNIQEGLLAKEDALL